MLGDSSCIGSISSYYMLSNKILINYYLHVTMHASYYLKGNKFRPLLGISLILVIIIGVLKFLTDSVFYVIGHVNDFGLLS